MVTIYGEYLFLENFAVGYAILRLTGLLCGRKPSYLRITAGAVLCGIFAFILFVNLSKFVSFLIEILFALVLAFIVFRPSGRQALVRLTIVFYCISFLTGGSAIAFIYMSGCAGVVSNGIFYIGKGGYMLIIIGAFIGIAGVFTVVKYVRNRAPRGDEIVGVSIDIMGGILKCQGKVDSGNYLRDPLSGRPVSLIEREVAEKTWGEIENNKNWENRVRVIPYKSVGCEEGTLMAVRCDSITIDKGEVFGRGKIYLRNAIIGFYEGSFSKKEDEEKYSILLQPDVIAEGTM
ncbi:MAG: sigma-E processing peptidase SpoIIGA [Firmicutes bacterium]|nr:sigma-E processing peptidase SpoIIGA [Bacillota bacterium]